MKKMTFVVLLLTVALTAVITWFASLYMFERPVFDESVEQKAISSQLLGEERKYLIHLPKSYERAPNRHYPVIYVLDGSSQDIHTAASAALMARIGVIPEVIVVGIPNIDGKGRQRDYTPPMMLQDIDDKDSPTGRADKFLAFMNQELIPEIDKSYRTTSSRALAGNSRGGLFVIYAFTAEPTLFETYYAHSPAMWRDNEEMVKQLDHFLKANPSVKSTLFLSLGSEENDKMKGAFQSTITTLQNHAPVTLRWRSQFTIGARHGNNAELATPIALRWAFDSKWEPEETAYRFAP
ncbi:alpha/beta hydrolase-fold protein [Rheinheimera sp. 1928-s]|uniref:alpha/beta hydrolase n=1 Tax=Rheinheimera sp. 1928-s TaxID=3033803 RepID=UPI0026091F5B|nr:alpha/beta hydrolase-fold protein [Rheinheimera sp. 1928-s]MDF3126509.1 alpha/beta hydrolase-fold protein [Rheinheimera sp. 1928-s]